MDIQHYKSVLLAKQIELQRSLASTSSDIHIEHVPDELDNVVSRSGRELALAGRDRSATTLRRVMAALQRVEDGSFGLCCFCEKDMPEKRLVALPWAERCVQCQEAHDRAVNEHQAWGLEDIA